MRGPAQPRAQQRQARTTATLQLGCGRERGPRQWRCAEGGYAAAIVAGHAGGAMAQRQRGPTPRCPARGPGRREAEDPLRPTPAASTPLAARRATATSPASRGSSRSAAVAARVALAPGSPRTAAPTTATAVRAPTQPAGTNATPSANGGIGPATQDALVHLADALENSQASVPASPGGYLGSVGNRGEGQREGSPDDEVTFIHAHTSEYCACEQGCAGD